MIELERTRRKIDFKKFKNRHAEETDFDELIDEPFILRENGKLIVALVEPSQNLEALRQACKTIKYTKSYRSNGLLTTSRVFGYEPRKTLRKDYCNITSISRDHPNQSKILLKGAQIVSDNYKQINPELHAVHRQMTETKLADDWKLKDAPFTSGIVNENNPLKYHFDAGNYKNVWSGMVVFKEGIQGGYLSLPEFRIGIGLRDKSILYFDGQGIMHGVTPIKRLHSNAKRYSIVYYSLQGMWNCLPINDEVLRIKRLRSEREERRSRNNQKMPLTPENK
jgi:hypothetical protein